jgi:hypothetical protein
VIAGAGDIVWLDLRLGSLRQLFNAMDPAPFRERNLDAEVASWIRDWVDEQGGRAPLGIRVTVTAEPVLVDDRAALREALHANFARRAAVERRRLARLFRDGRLSLVIGLAFLALAIAVAEWAAARMFHSRYAQLVEETVVIGGWVALWQPLSIFLYEWWPIRRAATQYDRLARAEVELQAGAGG